MLFFVPLGFNIGSTNTEYYEGYQICFINFVCVHSSIDRLCTFAAVVVHP